MEVNNKINKNIQQEPKNKNNNENNLKDNNKLEQDFQKEIDKKIKNQDKKEQKDTKNNESETIKEQEYNKSKIKDLSDLKLFVLPYINKDLLSINLKQSLNLDDKILLNNQNKPNEFNYHKKEIFDQKNPYNLQSTKKIEDSNKDYLNINPFEKFEKLYNSLKEISKEEKIKESKIIQQLIDNINIKELENKRMVELNINKEIFGNLKIQILNEDNKVTVLFKTDSKYTLDLIKNNVNQLKEMLKDRNLFVDNIKVEYEEES